MDGLTWMIGCMAVGLTIVQVFTVLSVFAERLRLPCGAAVCVTLAAGAAVGFAAVLMWRGGRTNYYLYAAVWLLLTYALCASMIRGCSLQLLFVLALTVRASQMAELWATVLQRCFLAHVTGLDRVLLHGWLVLLLHGVGMPLWMRFFRQKLGSLLDRPMPLPVWRQLWITPAAFILLCRVALDKIDGIPPTELLALALLWTAGAFVGYNTCMTMVAEAERRTRLAEDAARLRLRQAADQSRYVQLQATVEDARRQQHDLRHHWMTLQALCRQHEDDRAVAYLDDLMAQQAAMTPRRLCGHAVLDYLLRQFAERAAHNGVTMTVEASVTDDTRVSAVDLAVVLCNLTENALLAAADRSKGWVSIRVKQDGGAAVLIHVENSYAGEIPTDRHGRLLSSRHGGRGVGTASVTTCAERNGGMARFAWENGVFTADVRVCAGAPEKDTPWQEMEQRTVRM